MIDPAIVNYFHSLYLRLDARSTLFTAYAFVSAHTGLIYFGAGTVYGMYHSLNELSLLIGYLTS